MCEIGLHAGGPPSPDIDPAKFRHLPKSHVDDGQVALPGILQSPPARYCLAKAGPFRLIKNRKNSNLSVI